MDLLGIGTAILSALSMGTVGIFAKKTGLGAEVITFFRLGLGAVFMLLALALTGQTRHLRRWPSWPVCSSRSAACTGPAGCGCR